MILRQVEERHFLASFKALLIMVLPFFLYLMIINLAVDRSSVCFPYGERAFHQWCTSLNELNCSLMPLPYYSRRVSEPYRV